MAEAGKLYVSLGAKVDQLKSDLAKGKREIDVFGKSVNRIAGVVAGAFAISRIINFGKEISNLAGEAAGVEYAFKRIGDEKILEGLRKATRGTVSDLELMKGAVQASNFKIPIEQLAKLFEFANRRAQSTGQSVDYLVQSIVMGIGRKSPLILDNLGISAIELREKLKGVGGEAATIGDVAKAVGDIAERELGKMGPPIQTSKDLSQQLTTELHNIKVELGKRLNRTFIDDAKESLVGFLQKTKEFIIGTSALTKQSGLDEFREAIKGLSGDELKTAIQEQSRVFAERSKSNEGLVAQMESQRNVTDKLTKSNIALTTPLNIQINAQKKYGKALNDVSKEIWSYFENAEKFKELEKELKPIVEGVNEAVKNIKPPEPIFDLGIKNEFDFGEAMDFAAEADRMAKSLPEWGGKVAEAIEPVRTFKDALAELGEEFLNIGSNSDTMQEFADNVISSSKRIISAYIATGVAGAVKQALSDVPFPFNIIAAGIAGGAAAALFNSIVPSFANEGQVNRPTLAMVGDYAGASTNPEYMLKKSTLEKMGGNIHITLDARSKGKDLYWTIKKYERFLNANT